MLSLIRHAIDAICRHMIIYDSAFYALIVLYVVDGAAAATSSLAKAVKRRVFFMRDAAMALVRHIGTLMRYTLL